MADYLKWSWHRNERAREEARDRKEERKCTSEREIIIIVRGRNDRKLKKKNRNMRAVSRSLTRSVRRQMRGGAGEDGMMEGSFSRFSSQDAADKSERTGSALHRYSVCLRVLPHPLCRGLRMCARHCLPLIPQHEY